MAEKDDTALHFFLVRKHTVVIAVEQTHYGLVGAPTVTIFEDLNVRIFGRALLEAFPEFNRSVVGAVMSYKTTHKTHYDTRRPGLGGKNCVRSGLRSGNCG